MELVLLLPSIFGKAPRRQVLLLGHAGAGKTTLFAALRLGAGAGGPEMRGATLVSAAPNVAPLENVGDVDLVDVPGHPRLRLAMLERSSLWRKVAAVRIPCTRHIETIIVGIVSLTSNDVLIPPFSCRYNN